MLHRVIIILAFVSGFKANAQHAWGTKAVAGFLVPHNEGMSAQMQHITGLEFAREWKVDSGGVLDKSQFHPYCGIGINYFNLGNSINGNAFGVFNYYDAGIPLGKKSSWRWRFAVGVGYVTKEFNAFTNPMNRAIGSRLNGFMQIFTYVKTPVSKRLELHYGLGMSHYSNGNWSMPNLGINLPSLMLGLLQKDSKNQHLHALERYRVPEVAQYEISFRAGRRQIGVDDPRNIVNYLLEGSLIYPQNQFRKWRAGMIVFFDRTYIYTKFKPLPDNYRIDQVTEVALQAGHEYRIGKFGFVTDMGFYIFRPNRNKRMYYEGVGMKFYATENLVFMNRLKAHLTSADYFEFGMAWHFNSGTAVKPGFWNGWKWALKGFKG